MAASAAAGTSVRTSAKHRRGQLPVKRTINLADLGRKPLNLKIAIPAILLILAAAFLFGKYAVADRLLAVSRAEGEVAAMKGRLDEGYRRLDSFGELTDLYAHYTFSGMTDEEVHRTDRAEVMKLLRNVVLPKVAVDSWSLSGNELMINMTGSSLQVINRTVQEIEAQEIVSFCTVNTAKTNDPVRTASRTDPETEPLAENSSVTAQVVAYLNPDEGVDKR